MNAFPLSPFLASLATEGFRVSISDYRRISLVLQSRGPWTVIRLRRVLLALLVHEAEQESNFIDQFNTFFDLSLKPEIAFYQIDVHRVLEDLEYLAQQHDSRVNNLLNQGAKSRGIRTQQISRPSEQKNVEAKISSILRIFILIYKRMANPFGDKNLTISRWLIAVSITIFPMIVSGLVILFRNLSNESSGKPNTIVNTASNIWIVLLAIAFLFIVIIISTILLFLFKGRSLSWNPDAPRHFHFGKIGGKPSPRMTQTDLDYIADSMGYFKSEQVSKDLDIPSTVEATVRNCGIPTLIYLQQKHLRTVLILEDAFAEPLIWNSVSIELAEGLIQRGIPVMYGRFYGSLAKFQTSDGMIHRLEDFEDFRSGLILLVFSDGKSLHRHRDTFALEAIARWPQVAWMELREPRFWDESTSLISHYAIPIHPATSKGLFDVIDSYLKERGLVKGFSKRVKNWQGIPTYSGANINTYLEELLGDSLLWAQACAVMQPVSLGLADTLRQQFHPNLPPERVGRLFIIPGTTWSVAGLKFSKLFLAALRSGFVVRRSKDAQRDVLKFILKKISETEPDDRESLAHLTWEWALERVRIGLEPSRALARLKELARTPLRDSIREDLKEIIISELGNNISIAEIENYWRQANDLLRRGEYDQATQQVIKGLKEDPDNEALKIMKARIEEAVEILKHPGKVTFIEQTSEDSTVNISAKSIHKVTPEYPMIARQNSVSGVVPVEVKIDERGDVIMAEAFDGPVLLRQASETAVVKWIFRPARNANNKVKSTKIITFNFNI